MGGRRAGWYGDKGTGARETHCEDSVWNRPASEKKGSKGRNKLDCIRGKERPQTHLDEGRGEEAEVDVVLLIQSLHRGLVLRFRVSGLGFRVWGLGLRV